MRHSLGGIPQCDKPEFEGWIIPETGQSGHALSTARDVVVTGLHECRTTPHWKNGDGHQVS
jgi:hypothetical protein